MEEVKEEEQTKTYGHGFHTVIASYLDVPKYPQIKYGPYVHNPKGYLVVERPEDYSQILIGTEYYKITLLLIHDKTCRLSLDFNVGSDDNRKILHQGGMLDELDLMSDLSSFSDVLDRSIDEANPDTIMYYIQAIVDRICTLLTEKTPSVKYYIDFYLHLQIGQDDQPPYNYYDLIMYQNYILEPGKELKFDYTDVSIVNVISPFDEPTKRRFETKAKFVILIPNDWCQSVLSIYYQLKTEQKKE